MNVRTGCWEVWTDASWNISFSIQQRVRTERYVVRTDATGLSGVRWGWTRRPDWWNSGQMDVRTGWYVVWTADKESKIFYLFRSAEFSENALTSGIHVYNIFTHKWFCPNTEWGQNTNTYSPWCSSLAHFSTYKSIHTIKYISIIYQTKYCL